MCSTSTQLSNPTRCLSNPDLFVRCLADVNTLFSTLHQDSLRFKRHSFSALCYPEQLQPRIADSHTPGSVEDVDLWWGGAKSSRSGAHLQGVFINPGSGFSVLKLPSSLFHGLETLYPKLWESWTLRACFPFVPKPYM